MPGQIIGTVNVQIGQSPTPRVNNITYGGRSLKSANDLSLAGAQSGDVIVYQANTNSFIVEPASAVIPELDLDSGFF
jgi:hypothetical protein